MLHTELWAHLICTLMHSNTHQIIETHSKAVKIIQKKSVSLSLSEWVIPSLAGVLCGDWVRDRDWERVEPSSEVNSCSPSAGEGGVRDGRMRGLQGGVEDWSSGMTAGVSGMRGGWVGRDLWWRVRWEGRRGGRVREISGYTQMLESGHAHLLLHKISKILIFQALGAPWLVVMGFLWWDRCPEQ